MTIAKLAQETLVSLNGGQMLSDDFAVSERQVRYLWATNIAARFSEKLDAYAAQNRSFPDEWRSRFVVSLQPLVADSPDGLAPRIRYQAMLPGKVWGLTVRRATNDGVDDLLDGPTVDQVENALAPHAGRGHGRWANAKCVYSLHSQTVYISTFVEDEYLNELVIEGFVVPSLDFLVENAHSRLTIPDSWLRDLRLETNQQAAVILSTPADTVNDGEHTPTQR